MPTERKVADTLIAAGINATVNGMLDDEQDGEVRIAGSRVHIQVGESYLIVCRHSASEEEFWVQQVKETTLKNLVADVRSVLSN